MRYMITALHERSNRPIAKEYFNNAEDVVNFIEQIPEGAYTFITAMELNKSVYCYKNQHGKIDFIEVPFMEEKEV